METLGFESTHVSVTCCYARDQGSLHPDLYENRPSSRNAVAFDTPMQLIASYLFENRNLLYRHLVELHGSGYSQLKSSAWTENTQIKEADVPPCPKWDLQQFVTTEPSKVCTQWHYCYSNLAPSSHSISVVASHNIMLQGTDTAWSRLPSFFNGRTNLAKVMHIATKSVIESGWHYVTRSKEGSRRASYLQVFEEL
jgi:hypothetical protein